MNRSLALAKRIVSGTCVGAVVLSLCASAVAAQHAEPGDRLVVRIFGLEQLVADTIAVGGNGTVVLPKLGAVNVTDFPAAALPDSLRARYSRYLRNPTVDVLVLRRVVVNGEVKKPDIYYVDLTTTLAEAIAHAGGLSDAANAKAVSIRRGDSETNVPDWRTSKASIAQLRSGDQIYVGKRSWLSQNILPAASTVAVIASIIISLRR